MRGQDTDHEIVFLCLQVRVVTQGHLVYLDRRVVKATQDRQVSLDDRVSEVPLVCLDPVAKLVGQDLGDHLELMANLVTKDLRVSRVFLDLWDQ